MSEQSIELNQQNLSQNGKPSSGLGKKLIIVVVVLILLFGAGYWVITQYLFPSSFTPVELSNKEQQQLDKKLNKLGIKTEQKSSVTKRDTLEPEPYSEVDAEREVFFSEKEVNALLANNTDLASKLAIDLSDNLASAKLIIDMDPDFPVLGGKTLKVTAGMELRLGNGKPRAVLKGVSLWGIPVPSAWLGNLKNIDLLKEFGDTGGFWQSIKQGVEEVEITDGKLRVKLRE